MNACGGGIGVGGLERGIGQPRKSADGGGQHQNADQGTAKEPSGVEDLGRGPDHRRGDGLRVSGACGR